MPKVWCGAIGCANNKNNRCTAAEINLSEGHIHTVYQGFKQVWECRTYNMSKESNQIAAQIKEWLQQSAASADSPDEDDWGSIRCEGES